MYPDLPYLKAEFQWRRVTFLGEQERCESQMPFSFHISLLPFNEGFNSILKQLFDEVLGPFLLIAPGLHGLQIPGAACAPASRDGAQGDSKCVGSPGAVSRCRVQSKTPSQNTSFEGVIPSRQTLLGQGSGFTDMEPVHELRNVLMGAGECLAT